GSYVLGHSGTRGAFRRYLNSPGVSLGTRGLLGGLPEVVYGSGTRRQMPLSESTRRVCCLGFGTRDRWRARRHPEGFSRLGVFGDTWRVPKVGPKGQFRK